MSLSRSPATLALLRSLTKSAAPQVSRLCPECLHSPASCQISSIVQATSAGHAIPSARWQSTATSSSIPTNDTHTTLMPLGTASLPSSTNPEEAATTTSDSASTSSGVASSSQAAPTPALPSLNDLEALKARNIRLPNEASPADSPEVGMYNRRFKRIAGRVSKAFNKEQLIHLAKMLKLENTTFKSGKTALVKQILTQHWGYVDPAEIVARDAERRQREESTPKDVIKEIPVTEKELFFLLSKGHTSQLLRRLSGISSRVRVSIRNRDSPELQLTGPSHLVKSIEAEWTRLRKGIKTEVLDTNLSEPLRPDLCKSISLQADAFITQKGIRSRKLEVSHRSESSVPTRRAEACLRYLAVQSATMRDSPRFGFLDSAADNIAYLPTVPENQLPWDLRALPTLAISRYTSTSPAAGPIKLYRANNQPEEATTQDLRSALFDPLVDVPGTLQFTASFGNLLRVAPSASLEQLDDIMQSDWASKPDTAFLPATYTGFANRYSVPLRRVESRHIEEHTRNLSVTTQYIRRLIYVSNDISTPLGILKFERELASPKEAAQSSRVDEEDQLKAWSVYEGRRNMVHISMPHSINDVRLEATKMESGSEEMTAPLANVTRNAAPMTITVGENTYHLLEDNMIRSTKFVSGIPEPLASYKDTLEPVLERRTNMLHKQRSMALELHGSSPAQALESVTHMLQHL